MSRASKPDPRTCILDAAEEVIAESGFAGASLRDIVLRARVNLATVYYYYGSKLGLMEAVLKRRFGPLREEHQELLRQFEATSKGRPLRVEQILEAMLLPPLRLAASAPAKHQAVMRLIGRIVTEPNPQIQDFLRGQRAPVRMAFVKAFRRSLPRASLPSLQWRIELVWAALAGVLCNPRKIALESHGACNLANTKEVLPLMIDFFAPGFHALAGAGRKR